VQIGLVVLHHSSGLEPNSTFPNLDEVLILCEPGLRIGAGDRKY
jgi:hypothetical protein